MSFGKRVEADVVYVGGKPTMSYVLASLTVFHGGCDQVILKARGRAISKAVDTAEIIRNRFLKDVEVKSIKISTETLKTAEGNEINTSAIEIVVARKS
ncbi:MAG: DNA-binding protein Alba [Candidatus Wukongarchaeota archaeon]|nr:DNA-binding protein Alba [Candidatus Wukongarchaeota archaeon]